MSWIYYQEISVFYFSYVDIKKIDIKDITISPKAKADIQKSFIEFGIGQWNNLDSRRGKSVISSNHKIRRAKANIHYKVKNSRDESLHIPTKPTSIFILMDPWVCFSKPLFIF
ncbi:hypothetical protein HZS_65 [Henneguya salminicola]|nr:hypothetical protein HZS_65 [Henneguya salminicola]